MLRFTLKQLFMGTALIGVILSFTQAEGRGTRYARIESLSFTSDDARILVSKLTGRDARRPLKHYKADLARTVSLVDAQAGINCGVIHQSFKPGNCGPTFQFWWMGRTSALCNSTNDRIAMSAFGGGEITCDVGTAKPTVLSLQLPACNIVYSKSGRFLAASSSNEVAVFDT